MKISSIIFVVLSVMQRKTFALREQKVAESVNYLIQNKEISSQCAKSLKLYMDRLNSVDEKEIWGLQMLDATSKIPVSLLSYSFTEIGNFNECIEIESKRDQIKGKYCLGKVSFNSTIIATKYSGEIGSKVYYRKGKQIEVLNKQSRPEDWETMKQGLVVWSDGGCFRIEWDLTLSPTFHVVVLCSTHEIRGVNDNVVLPTVVGCSPREEIFGTVDVEVLISQGSLMVFMGQAAGFVYHLYLKYLLKDIANEAFYEVQHPSWAMCLPSDCSNEDAKRIMSKPQTVGATIGSVTCQTIEDVYPTLDGGAIIGISIFSILFLIVIASTVYDIHCQNKKIKSDSPIYIAFSIYTNGKSLFQITSRSSPLSCLDGIRVISTIWVIYYHSYEAFASGLVFNPDNVVNITNYVLSMVNFSASLACDTFFTVGGILVTYSFFKKEKKAELCFGSLTKYYFHRYIRLTPPLAGLVLVCATLTKYLGSGPRWPDIIEWHQNTCVNYWWSSLLYLQNIVNVDQPCTSHTWYLDIDMQLYILSPFILWMLQKYTKTGIFVLILGALASMVNAFFVAYENKLSAVFGELNAVTPFTEYLTKYYYKTETRVAPSLIGLVFGYMLTKKEFTEISVPKAKASGYVKVLRSDEYIKHLLQPGDNKTETIGINKKHENDENKTLTSEKIIIPMWILSITVTLFCVFGGHMNLKGPEYDRLQNSLHIALVRPAFALALCWMIWACSTNHGGIINTLLSLPIFTFMMKFTFSMYVVHVFMVFAISYASKTAVHITAFNQVYWFWSSFMFVFGVSIIWVLLFESPFMVLEEILFQKLGARSKAE